MAEEVKFINLDELKKELNETKGKITSLETEKKQKEDKRDLMISQAIYDKKNAIEKTFNEILSEAERRLAAAKSAKEDEKRKKVAELIKNNTKETKDKNKFLKAEIKNVLKQSKLPAFVNTDIYYALFSPRKLMHFVKAFLIFIIILCIPSFLCFFIYKEQIYSLSDNQYIRYFIIGLVYAVCIFVFGVIWLSIDKITKKDISVIDNIAELRKNIFDNKKQIRKISIDTRKNIDDNSFDYTALDREIETATLDVANRKKEKEEALIKFQNTTEKEIKSEITKLTERDIKQLDKDIENTKEELNKKQKEYDDYKIQSIT